MAHKPFFLKFRYVKIVVVVATSNFLCDYLRLILYIKTNLRNLEKITHKNMVERIRNLKKKHYPA